MRAFFIYGACGAFACSVVMVSCGSSNNCSGSFCADQDGSTDVTTFDVTDSNIGFGETGKDSGNCSVTCSGDLHDVVDCNGNVVTACPPDQGCAAGTCVAACAAASANKSSVGCDYYVVPATDFTGETCLGVYVANTWGSPVTLTVGWGANDYTSTLSSYGYLPTGSGQSLTYTALTGGQVPVGDVAILFLSGADCPKPTATSTDVSNAGTQVTNAFHITADRPVVLYDIFPYGGGSSAVTSATLLLPTSVWDVNYVATSGWSETGFGNPWIAFVAQQDGTQISIVPTAAITGATGVAADAQNVVGVYNLMAGQLLRIQQPTDLTGSIVSVELPHRELGRARLHQPRAARVRRDAPADPPGEGAGQRVRRRALSQQALDARGVAAVAIRRRGRRHDAHLRSAADGRTDDARRKGSSSSGTRAGPFIVTSQDQNHPFYFAAHMTGCFTLPGNYSSPVGLRGRSRDGQRHPAGPVARGLHLLHGSDVSRVGPRLHPQARDRQHLPRRDARLRGRPHGLGGRRYRGQVPIHTRRRADRQLPESGNV